MNYANAIKYLREIAAHVPTGREWNYGRNHQGHSDFCAAMNDVETALRVIPGYPQGECLRVPGQLNWSLYTHDSRGIRDAVYAHVQATVREWLSRVEFTEDEKLAFRQAVPA